MTITQANGRPGTARAVSDRTPGSVMLTSLSKAYGGATVVNEVSLEVRAGEFLALLGPSGCGKSTTLRMVAGLEQPDRGTVEISGCDVTRLPAHRRDIHTVFQSYALFPHLDVADNVAFPLRQRGVARDDVRRRVAEALAMVRLPDAGSLSVTSLSGGQQQRVALARAVVDRPAVLLLDEPLSALDRALRQAMQVEMRLLQQDLGVTSILVTHDQEEALSLADRIAIMADGRLQQVGSAEDVYDRPANLFVARFVGEQNEVAGHCDARGVLRNPTVSVTADGQAPAGRSVALIRPEHLRVEPAENRSDAIRSDANAVNRVAGLVRGVSIAGICSVVLVHADGLNLIARVPRDGRPTPQLGDPVCCSWSSRHVRIFADTEGRQA